jgi:hypothetical protein
VYPAQLIRRDRESLVIYEGTRESGVYRLMTPQEETVNYVVPADGRESDLMPCDASEREKVSKLIGVRYAEDRREVLRSFSGEPQRTDLWWWLLVGLLGLLCLEVWMTRRMVINR